jgi:hypothetical protein
MFIALQHQSLCAPAERYVLVAPSVYMPLLTERDRSEIWGYKYVAPTEQKTSIPMMTTFRAKPLYACAVIDFRRAFSSLFNAVAWSCSS